MYILRWNLSSIQNNAVCWAKCAYCMCVYMMKLTTHKELIKCVKESKQRQKSLCHTQMICCEEPRYWSMFPLFFFSCWAKLFSIERTFFATWAKISFIRDLHSIPFSCNFLMCYFYFIWPLMYLVGIKSYFRIKKSLN